ncbi:MAG TPA: hypothetical protein V6D08_00200, partial [Candidatus Obscuribacterales bacterium]
PPSAPPPAAPSPPPAPPAGAAGGSLLTAALGRAASRPTTDVPRQPGGPGGPKQPGEPPKPKQAPSLQETVQQGTAKRLAEKPREEWTEDEWELARKLGMV